MKLRTKVLIFIVFGMLVLPSSTLEIMISSNETFASRISLQTSKVRNEEIRQVIAVPRLMRDNHFQENSSLGGLGSSIIDPPLFAIGESNETHVFVPDPTNQTDGSYVLRESGYQELNSSRGQSYRHFYNGTSGEYTFNSDYLVNKTGVIDNTDWVVSEEYPTRVICRLTNGSIYFSEDLTQVVNFFNQIDNSTLWAVGIETFSGILGFYMNPNDIDWGHYQYVYWPRLLSGQISGYNLPLYGIYPHLYAKLSGVWYDKLLNDRSLYQGIVNPRNTLHFNKTVDTWELWFNTFGITIMGRIWDFTHGFKYNLTDQQFHMITKFRCRDQDFEDLGMGYEITSSPQCDQTPFQPERFIFANETYEIVVGVSEAWKAGTYLQDFYSFIEIISQNNESFKFTFQDMEDAGFTEKYLEVHDQQFPDGSTRKVLLAGMYGFGSYSANTVIEIDPTFSEKMETGLNDFRIYFWTGEMRWYCSKGPYMVAGFLNTLAENNTFFIAFDSGLTTNIQTTSDASMTFYVEYDYLDANEYLQGGLYDKGDADEYWDEIEAEADEEGAHDQEMYWSDASFWVDPDGTGNKTIADAKTGTLIDNWVTHHNSAPASRQYIPMNFKWGTGCEQNDWIQVSSADCETASQRPTLTFTYTLGGANTAPEAEVDTAVDATLYAGKSFTTKTNHTDADGSADLAELFIGLGDDPFDITINSTASTGSLVVYTINGSAYVSSVSASGSSITNGFQVTWTLVLDWDFPFDDLATIDTHARSRDDEPEYSSWDTHNTNSAFENDLEVVSLLVAIDGQYEYGGTNDQIDDDDWFKGGEQVNVSGSVEYEGSSQTFNSSYASGVNVTLHYDGTSTGQGDTVILAGAFNNILYTPTSASGLDTTAYFDVQIYDIPTNGSDVTTAGIEITSKRDNENPSGYSISLTADTVSIGYTPNTGYYDDDSVDTSVSGATDGSGSGLPSDCYAYQLNAEGWGAWTSDTTYQFTSVSDGDHSLYVKVRDNVNNEGSADSTTVTVDIDSPTGFTLTLSRHTGITNGYYAYQTGSTIYFNSGQTDYFTVQVNDDGTIQNSLFWKVEWDKNSVFEAAANDTSGLPDSKNFNYQGDSSGTFLIRVVNNAGNYQTFTYTATEDVTAPSGYSLSLDPDTASIGYTPNAGYYDDDSVDFTATASGSITETGAGLPTTCYAYQWNAEGYGSWLSSNTYQKTAASDGSHTAYVKVRDNVGNEGSAQSVGVIVDTDSPLGFTITWSRHTGSPDGYYAYQTGSTIYFNSGQTDYFTVQVNDDGTIQNSGFWFLVWDNNSVFETSEEDSSGLPDSKNFNYQGDSSGTFLIRVVNNAGNYQTFTYTATEDITTPSGTLSSDQDLASIGYQPQANYDDDSTIDFTTSGASDSGSGLPSNCYSYNNSVWTSSTTKQYTGQSDTNHSVTVTIRDNVGNNATSTAWIIIDTDTPTGFTWTWSRVNGTYPCIQNSSGFYYDDSQNDYSTITVNDDGSINNSLFWKIEWDKNSILITGVNDTSGLPDSRDFNYFNDDNGTLIVRIINNAGNYQSLTIECYDSYDSGEPPDTTTNSSPISSTEPWNPSRWGDSIGNWFLQIGYLLYALSVFGALLLLFFKRLKARVLT